MSFHVGQHVECIDARVGFGSGEPVALILHAKYVIRIIVDGDINVGGLACYSPKRFRPVIEDRKSISFTMGAPKDSERWDNRKKIKEKAVSPHH